MSIISKIATIAAAVLLAGTSLAGAQGQGGTATTPAVQPKSQTTGACRVRDLLGGRSCTGDVPEAACAAIAKEAKGQYTWTQEECP